MYGFCLSRLNYDDLCVCYILDQLCFRISGLSLKKEAVYFWNVVDSVEYFLRQWEKKIPVSTADTTFVTALSKYVCCS